MKLRIFVATSTWLLAAFLSADVQAKPCECKDLDKIRTEIQRTRKAIDVWKEIFGWARGMLEGVKPPATNDELNTKFVQLSNAPPSEWRRILAEPVEKVVTPQKVGELNQVGEVVVNEQFAETNCDGIVEGIRVHERTHRSFYTSGVNIASGSALTWRLIRTRAESEVEAYRAQTIYLDALVTALELKCDGELVYEADSTMNMPPLIAYKITSSARIAFKIDENKKITGSGTQTIKMEQLASGACTATNADSQYEWIVSGQEEGGFLLFKFSPKGATTVPGIQMTCRIGNQQGQGMSLPMPFGIGDVRIEKKDRATRQLDLARISGGRVTGKAVTTLYIYKE